MIAGVAITSALVIGIYDNITGNFMEQKMFAGWLIIFSNLMVLFALVFFTILKIFLKVIGYLVSNRKTISLQIKKLLSLLKYLTKKKTKIDSVVPL